MPGILTRPEARHDCLMTPRVRIIPLPPETLTALAAGDLDAANASSPVPLTAYLVSPEARSTWAFRARQAVESPEDLPWVTGAIWDEDAQAVVGKAGFHAAPDERGMVELGYAVDPALRRRGYARAAFSALLERAWREPDVRILRATVSPDNVASRSLIEEFGLVENGEQWDDEDGLELIYEIAVHSAGPSE
jgi:ribosomal-protein-alanine N-acetyltransferase